MWVAGEVTENQKRVKQAALFPLGPLPHIQCHNAATWLPRPGKHLRLRPLLCNRHAKTKTMAQMKEEIKAPGKKIELNDEEIVNLSDAQFKKLVIKMLTELT